MSRLLPLVLLACCAMQAINAVAQSVVLTPSTTTINPAGGTLTFTAAVTYSDMPAVLAFSATLPVGWTYLSGNNEPPVKPSAGTSGELGWAYTTAVPASPATFTFTASYPANLTGLQPLTTSTVARSADEAPPVTMMGPTVTLQAPPTAFTWMGDAATNNGSWTDPSQWSPIGTVPNNVNNSTYSARFDLGTATITGGTAITINDLFLYGGSITGGGSLTLAGSASSWTNGALSALGQLQIAPNAVLTASTFSPHNFDGTAIVNQGQFIWQNGGALRSGNGGSFTNAAGATFTDASSGTVDYLITNGFGGTFTFSNAGTYVKATANSTTRIEVPFTNTGNLRIDGGTLRFASTFTQDAGVIRLAGATTLAFDNGLTFPNGSLIGSGMIAGNVTIGTSNAAIPAAGAGSQAVATPAPLLSPGDTLGRLTIQGNLTLLDTSKLLIDLGGTNQGVDYDFLSVSGNAALGGTLAIGFQNNFGTTANPATLFTVLTSASLTGAFANVANGGRLTTFDGVGSFVVNYTSTSLTLTNFQMTPVPEPSTWALLISGLGVLALGAYRRRRRA